jgi:3-isopropylmalate/(R)-2-methylmalate dehydratase small subunit
VLEGADLSWPKTIKPGDIVIGGANFGCGSLERARPLGLKGYGIHTSRLDAVSFGAHSAR